jgi:hypothetical protein
VRYSSPEKCLRLESDKDLRQAPSSQLKGTFLFYIDSCPASPGESPRLVALPGPVLNAYFADRQPATAGAGLGGFGSKSVRNIHRTLQKAVAKAAKPARAGMNATGSTK